MKTLLATSLLFAAALSAAPITGGSCGSGTVADYLTLGDLGCTEGPFRAFGFQNVTSVIPGSTPVSLAFNGAFLTYNIGPFPVSASNRDSLFVFYLTTNVTSVNLSVTLTLANFSSPPNNVTGVIHILGVQSYGINQLDQTNNLTTIQSDNGLPFQGAVRVDSLGYSYGGSADLSIGAIITPVSSSVPEPSTAALFIGGLAAVAVKAYARSRDHLA
ncbi:MAG: hypothetical protein WKF37_02965 [Bryobacteraceae bacterium]